MSTLKELLNKHCPDGVEYKTLEEVCSIYTGEQLNRKNMIKEGYPVINGGVSASGYTDKYNEEENTITIAQGGNAGFVNFINTKFWAGAHCYVIKPIIENINNKFLFYVLKNIEKYIMSLKTGTTILGLQKIKVLTLKIPIPPIEVQKEIVRILDEFTEKTTKLQELLHKETILRKKQYEYYRDKLLTFSDEVEYKFLGEVCNVQYGGTPLKTKVEYWENGNIKWLGSGVCENQKTVNEITNYISELGLEKSSAKLMKKDTTLIALVGATIGKVAFLPFEAAINQNIAGVYPIDINKLNPSFVYYICTTYYKDFISLGNGKLTMANLSFVRNLKIPVPPLKEQERIVNILDKFDALCNDITKGLPAEIEMRKKQYEYYRDKLLTFKEKKKC